MVRRCDMLYRYYVIYDRCVIHDGFDPMGVMSPEV